ncbi:putative high-affinity nickel-transport protein [Gordonia polyisoprenivorans NBRC 16320 = JCM 10675]|uniref:Nickel/cobalt efflux system n=1 Tax=Gordonia polyisoprenivorans TaxID=84595 RepID=A0A846WNR2_9ACTN|nr:HoxN/HupN/NixA family nickel/cobalt transporter [Gordonia polyisoprenivorans]NKY03235.1 HoxN/HupN/NixA family nickel/cobalt transporter [Gordonia polyisoprenivorans]GAB21722.1 putative high-affinity nickel-transport protein [Gordonia polyisoprenivorans NBRC 16320 = JCM 10675]
MATQFAQQGQTGRPSFGGRLAQLRRSLTPAEWASIGGMVAVVAALHIIGWVTLVVFVAPHDFSVGQKTLGLDVGLTAYTLGMRHAFDADHISAIDNTTRKLLGDGQRPMTVGFWFSLGHSTIVFGLALLLSFGVRALAGPVEDDSSALHHYTGLIGTTVSGGFLYLIAAINIVILFGIVKVFRAMRQGDYSEDELENHLNNRGFMNRILGRFMKSVTKPWQMYPIGVLFGLGFDTATEVALLVLAGSSAAAGLPWYAILCLPVLFAAGMSLFDSIDGTFMNFAYGWAFANPVRKVYYNLTITGLSVVVAFVIGTIEILGLLADEFGWSGPFWDDVSGIDLNIVGYAIVGLFIVTWLVAVVIWRVGRIEQRWALAPATAAERVE